MKKNYKIAYIVLILISFLFIFFIYKVSGKDSSSEDIKVKTLSEVKYLESKFQNLFNNLNNISFDNYRVSSTDIKEKKSEDKASESSSKTSGENNEENSEESESSNDLKSLSEEDDSSRNNKQYKLEKEGILTKDSQIDWDKVKNDVEDIYTSLYSTTLDLYQTNTNKNDIINFNKEYDNLTKSVKDENKDDALIQLSMLYDYLPGFIENCTEDERERTIVKTKNNIFKAYSNLDSKDWDTISDNINSAIQEFTKIITDVNNQEKGNQYNINKSYVMINELQNAVELKDKEIFLIKYKNLLEELQNI